MGVKGLLKSGCGRGQSRLNGTDYVRAAGKIPRHLQVKA